MNTNHRRPARGIALAAFVLTLATACGSDVASAPANIGDPAERIGEPTDPPSGYPDDRLGQRPNAYEGV